MTAPIRLTLAALGLASLATTASAQATLEGNLGLVEPMFGTGTAQGTIPAGADVGLALDVSNGPAGGTAFYAFSSGLTPPLPTSFGSLLIDLGSITALGGVGIDPGGGASAVSTYATPLNAFQMAFQVATVDAGSGTVELTGAVALGHGTNLLKTCKGNILYNTDTQTWESLVTSRLIVPQTVTVEWFDASAGSTTTLDSGTVPGGATQFEGFLLQSGSVDLDPGDKLTVRCAGTDIGSVDG